MHRHAVDPSIPPADGPRAQLKARLRELASASPNSGMRFTFSRVASSVALFAGVGVLLAVIWLGMNLSEANAIPRADLTWRARFAGPISAAMPRSCLSSNARCLPNTACRMRNHEPMRSTT